MTGETEQGWRQDKDALHMQIASCGGGVNTDSLRILVSSLGPLK